MKKFLLTAAVMLAAGVSIAFSETLSVPTGHEDSLATADYGGVFWSTYTANFLVSGTGVHYATVTAPGLFGVPLTKNQTNGIPGVFYGFQFSTGTNADFADVYDSTSSDVGKNTFPMARIYNVGSSTGGTGAWASGFSGPSKPLRFYKGLIYRPSRADLNSLSALFYVFQ